MPRLRADLRKPDRLQGRGPVPDLSAGPGVALAQLAETYERKHGRRGAHDNRRRGRRNGMNGKFGRAQAITYIQLQLSHWAVSDIEHGRGARRHGFIKPVTVGGVKPSRRRLHQRRQAIQVSLRYHRVIGCGQPPRRLTAQGLCVAKYGRVSDLGPLNVTATAAAWPTWPLGYQPIVSERPGNGSAGVEIKVIRREVSRTRRRWCQRPHRGQHPTIARQARGLRRARRRLRLRC